jgi:hypothetical protein
MLPKLTKAECGSSANQACAIACADEVSCRMFLCGRCRSQVLVCRRCDRGQIYCVGTCAQEARRDHQREARRRYQASPRGRVLHAERSRRYRARRQCVTDHGPAVERETSLLLECAAVVAVSEPPSVREAPGHGLCRDCGRSASAFLRRSALRPRRHRARNNPSGRRSQRPRHPP